jgi:large subunit ribosomal protein L25
VAEITLKATIRDYKGRSASNQARRGGLVPGVFYFHNTKNIPIEVKALDLRPLVYTSETHIVNLELSDGSREKCILREVQFDPITDRIMHIDLVGLLMGEKMKFEVPVQLEGIPAGVRDGGVLQQVLHKLDVECLPTDLPEYIAIDVSKLTSGESINVGDIVLEKGVILNDPENTVAVVGHARAAVSEEEGAVAEADTEITEPEVLPRGKAEGEEG